ncbi:hypothetical protein [Streptomyces alkaliterrae]|uniref:DUF4461 domain-containing protein n=1 Tax=Streptomyces alkaliterrae TaxID=2213162 RepID=A0A5P0YVX6_9ACTN|nr:hypothetical protein [Streptomyces alkaliterrae]MBB1255980.1 hypothetical protein [Streptomyces alkaliterrae]MBB1261824.1 hypothetical protein [Streptomyces alkaliterrae]MQS04443.1 hypothetical protein [Streptomyces alkaliterrae]
MSDLKGSSGRRRVGRGADALVSAESEAPVEAVSPDAGLCEGTVDTDRLRRRARFLRELSEAQALRERVQPRRARVARLRQQMRMRTFRW